MGSVKKIPASIRTRFSERNWRFIVDCDAVAEFAEQLQMDCIGVCSYGDKAIFLAESNATDHEFGHFIHRMIGFPAEFEKLYETESKNTLPILREYSLTNSKEYFADFFRYWLENQDNDEKLDQIREAAPGTYLESTFQFPSINSTEPTLASRRFPTTVTKSS